MNRTLLAAALSHSYNPGQLFAAGEQGAWYNPSDYSTLFQDSAGTTPVTAVEQPVGLMLDKSKNGVGTNGAYRYNLFNYTEQFDNAYWTKSATTVTQNVVVAPDGTTSADLITNTITSTSHVTLRNLTGQNANFTFSLYAKPQPASSYNWILIRLYDGTSYTGVAYFNVSTGAVGTVTAGVTVTPQNVGDGWWRFGIAANLSTSASCEANFAFVSANGGSTVFVGDNTGMYVWGAQLALSTAPTAYQRIDATWYDAIPGNHAYQSTSASRPVLRARYNLLTYSEQFDNAVWTLNAASITPDSTTAPDSTLSADTLVEDTANTVHFVMESLSGAAAGSIVTLSIYAKNAGRQLQLLVGNSGVTRFAMGRFDLASGTYVGNGRNVSYTVVGSSITSVGSGWYRCALTVQTVTDAPARVRFYTIESSVPLNQESYTGDGTSGVYLWGAQLIVTNSLPSNQYQRIAAATDYDTNGFSPYLQFDGVDDSFLTNSVDFTATDKMTVWAGVRKLAAAGTSGITVELGTSNDSVSGSVALVTPGGASNQYLYGSRGTETVYAVTTSASFAAPITNVLTGTSDIAGDSVILRINGAEVASNTANQGTGAYQNAPLYIGRRNNATLPLNGNLFSLIIRGAASTTYQIVNTESWVNGKTGAY